MIRWSTIRGHRRVREVLERSVASGHLHHALLCTGPRGVGKSSLARALAAVVNCEQRPPGTFEDACGECPSCRKIAKDAHPDVELVGPDGATIKIRQIRELVRLTTTSPYEARHRFVILRDVHLMTDEAANALLKTLEEPSGRTLLVLTTDQPHLLLDTIVSRCQRLRFGALEREQILELLGELVADDEELDSYPGELLSIAAGFGEGSVGRALQVLRSGILEDRAPFLERILELRGGGQRAWLELAEDLGRRNDLLDEQIDLLLVFYRDVMRFLVAGGAPDALINEDLGELVADEARALTLRETVAVLEKLCASQERLSHNVNSQLVVEDMLAAIRAPSALSDTEPVARF